MLIIVTLRLIVQQSHLLTLVLSTLQAFYLYRLYAYGFDYLIILQRLIHAMLCFIYKSALFRNSNARTVNLFMMCHACIFIITTAALFFQ